MLSDPPLRQRIAHCGFVHVVPDFEHQRNHACSCRSPLSCCRTHECMLHDMRPAGHNAFDVLVR